MTRWRHKKRGSTYHEVGRARFQIQSHPDLDNVDLMVYQSESDGSMWVRPLNEFLDGRFEKLE